LVWIRIEIIHRLLAIINVHLAAEKADVITSVIEQMMEHFEQSDTMGKYEYFVAVVVPLLK